MWAKQSIREYPLAACSITSRASYLSKSPGMLYNPQCSQSALVGSSLLGLTSTIGLLMVDPDAPSKDDPTKADWLHWGLYNIPGDLLKYEALDVIEHAASGYSLMDCFAHYQAPSP